ncbi:MAG: GNAT family N-acetyltransferase [Burkholderiales bacterium]|nr:GNAT family N-acetyltransferase [Burkholderiales bacterium]
MSLDPSTPQLRAAAPGDLTAIVGLIGELAEYERLQHMVVVTPESLHPHLFGPKPAVEAVVAELDLEGEPRIVGFALFFTNFSTFLGRPGIHLEDLYVQPAFRSLGLGRMLLEHLAGLAVARGCGRFEWTVLDWNESAIRFYERMGAQVLPDWRICRLSGDALLRYG